MNKNKLPSLFVTSKTVLIFLSLFLLTLPAIAKCNKLAKTYFISITGAITEVPERYNATISKTNIPGTYRIEYTNIDLVGANWYANFPKDCNTIFVGLVVRIEDDVGIDGDVGDSIDLTYVCGGTLDRKSRVFGGICKLNQFVPEFNQTLTDEAKWSAFPTTGQKVKRINK